MSHNSKDYAALIRKRGFRVTPQRQMILDAICESSGHTTPEEIVKRVQAKSPAVNPATVYRNLDFLVQMRFVVSCDLGGPSMVYEIASETPHHHLVCLNCGEVMVIDHAYVHDFFSKIETSYHFRVETNHLALFGVCPECQSKGSQ